MKKFLLICLLFVGVQALAQEKVNNVVEDNYNRNSMSIIVVDRGEGSDKEIKDAVNSIEFGDKFDKNQIITRTIKIDKPRTVAASNGEIDKAVMATRIAKEIALYWFDSNHDGQMDGDLIAKRGRYNAKDQDVINAKSSQIGKAALDDAGYDLINNSYIMVLDYCQIKDGKDLFGNPNKTISLVACVYKVDFSENIVNSFFEKCWAYEDDSAETKAAKKAEFAKFALKLVPVAFASTTGSASIKDGGVKKAIANAYESALRNLENKIESWQVTVPVYKVKPISAKIGKKEGLKNTHRYVAYEVVAKEVKGEQVLESKKRGYVRAAKIANNSKEATGESPMSQFYQISKMKNIKAGQLLKQSNDLGMGVSVGAQVGGLAMAKLSVDYLASISTKGTSVYGLLDVGYDLIAGSEFDSSLGDYYTGGFSFINAGLGIGLGVRPLRFLEIMPYVMAGGDYIKSNAEAVADGLSGEEESEEEFQERLAYYGEAGLKINITVAYPFQVFAGVNYTMMLSEGIIYESHNNYFELIDKKREGGLGFNVGIKYIF